MQTAWELARSLPGEFAVTAYWFGGHHQWRSIYLGFDGIPVRVIIGFLKECDLMLS